MIPPELAETAPFEDRADAGRYLAQQLLRYSGAPILAIPNGGVPLAIAIAISLHSDIDVVISRKLPIPLRPEGGFGAVADDGQPIFNEPILKALNMTDYDINYVVNKVRSDILQRTKLYKGNKPPTLLAGKTVILVDDGLATGFTMLAAIRSLAKRNPKEIIVAAPSASREAIALMRQERVKLVLGAQPRPGKYYVAAAYKHWTTLSDSDVQRRLTDWYNRLSSARTVNGPQEAVPTSNIIPGQTVITPPVRSFTNTQVKPSPIEKPAEEITINNKPVIMGAPSATQPTRKINNTQVQPAPVEQPTEEYPVNNKPIIMGASSIPQPKRSFKNTKVMPAPIEEEEKTEEKKLPPNVKKYKYIG